MSVLYCLVLAFLDKFPKKCSLVSVELLCKLTESD